MDGDGRRYIDFKMGSASQMLGHCHPVIVEAIRKQAERSVFSADCHEAEIIWAEWVNRLYPSAERTRFTASGTEATMLAVRLGGLGRARITCYARRALSRLVRSRPKRDKTRQ